MCPAPAGVLTAKARKALRRAAILENNSAIAPTFVVRDMLWRCCGGHAHEVLLARTVHRGASPRCDQMGLVRPLACSMLPPSEPAGSLSARCLRHPKLASRAMGRGRTARMRSASALSQGLHRVIYASRGGG